LTARLGLKWTKGQHKFFNELTAPFRLMPTGRRCGKTQGAAQALIKKSAKVQGNRALWCDVVYRNIDRYIERYFLPVLKQFPEGSWRRHKQDKIIEVGDSLIDFGSADRPETLEGFGYNDIVVNEAGLILKGERGRYLWNNALLPMLMDYEGSTAHIIGTPKGKVDPDGNNSLYYLMYQKCLDPECPDYQCVTMATDENKFLSREAVERVKNELPTGAVRDQEFYGKFVQYSAGIISADWFRFEENEPDASRKVRSWDMAVSTKTSADSSAGALCSMDGNNKFTIHHMSRVKMLYPDFRNHLIETAWRDGTEVPIVIEKAGQMGGFIDDLRGREELRGFTIYEQKPERDKLTRALPWIAAAEGGKVFLVRGGWNQAFLVEAESFTGDDSHAHDDQVDAVSIAYRELSQGVAEQIDNPMM